MKYCKRFDSHAKYLTFILSDSYEEPNISICTVDFDEEHTHFNPIEKMIVCVFNVTDISEPTRIINRNDGGNTRLDAFTYIEIDGVRLEPVELYQFESTGLHTVKYMPAYLIIPDGALCAIPAISIKLPYIIKSLDIWSISTYSNTISDESLTQEPLQIDLNSVEILNGLSITCNADSIFIPKTVTQYGTTMETNNILNTDYKAAFYGEIQSITVDPENPIYDSRDNCNAVIETATNTLLQGFINTIIPNTVTTIAGCAFSFTCFGITSITIPNSVTNIKVLAFNGCNSLTSVYCQCTVPPTLGSTAFGEPSEESQLKIYVPAESLSDYEQATNWSDYYATGQILAMQS